MHRIGGGSVENLRLKARETTLNPLRQAGFDVLPNPTKKLPNHYPLIHSEGVAGFHEVNLARLSAVFTETSGHAV